MQGQTDEGFYARFLGGFSLHYKKREIMFGMGLRSRPAQCLLLLLKAGDAGAERKELLSLVRTVGDDQKKQLNNLYQHMHVLRDMLPGLGLPEGRYIVLRQGRYYFTTDHKVATDIGHLDGLIGQMRSEGLSEPTRRELCRAYCKGYSGEMLPQLSGEGWVTIEGAFYQRWYSRCLEELCASLKGEGRYEEILELNRTASQLHPYDGWQVQVVESLLALGRYREAEQVYRDAIRLSDGGLETAPLDQVMDRYRKDHRRAVLKASDLVGLEQRLSEEDVGVPYRCSYPSFRDIYRIVTRMGERQEAGGLLLLCTLRGQPLELGMARLRRVLEESLRACDVYTRYSNGQYLSLLTGAGPGDAAYICARLERGWQQCGCRDVCLEVTTEGIGDRSVEGAGDGEGNLYRACHQPGELHLAGADHMVR